MAAVDPPSQSTAAEPPATEPTATEAPAAGGTHDPIDYIAPEDDNELLERGPDFLDGVSEKGSSTNSLTSSVLNYQYENGRRYHGYREGNYLLPNDEREQDRMDLNHHIYRLATGGSLYRAPIGPDPRRILDLGTGTGIWAIEMADEFPKATVIGTDLSPIQPGWVPPNCYFEVDDYESEWDFSRPFDFIHGRSLEGTVTNFPWFFQQGFKTLKPGGWFEMAGIPFTVFCDDDTIENAPNLVKWGNLLKEASVTFGKPADTLHLYKGWMEDAGFQNIKDDIYKVPLSAWAKDRKLKELGAYQQANMLEAMESYSLALFTRVLGWTPEQVGVYLTGVREELMNRKLHLYAKYWFVYGQKPAA